MVEGGGACNAYPRRRVYAPDGGNGAGNARSLRRIWTMAEGNGARSACSRRRNCTLAEGNRARSGGSPPRCCAMRLCNRWRRSPWALNRGNCRCVTGCTGNRYPRILRNKRRCSRQYWRRTGQVYRTTVDLSFAGAEGTWMARVWVFRSGCGPRSRSRSGGRRGGQGWDTTMVASRVWVPEINFLTVYLAVPLVVPSPLT